MTGVASVYSSPLSHSLLPCLRRRLISDHFSPPFSCFHRFVVSHYHRHMFSSSPFKPPAAAIFAQARRGSSSSSKSKEEEIATPADLQFDAPLKIVEYPDPILRAKNKRINTFDDNLKKLVDEMFDVMYKTDGIGLSAPQVGKNVQLMVFNPVGERGQGEEVVLVNPKINRYSKKVELYNEGCLSFPGINADVERPESVRIDAQDIKGESFSFHLNELPARIFQHEYDHLQGILFFDRMSEDVLEGILADLQALEKKYEDRTGLPSPEKAEALRRKKRTAAVGFGKS
ncbi:OLC1v1035072C1 [Oldenlandia corymbosa var. corymbosa]|uniref:Peptide deformylase n=1 Tax=Oldenlandia corymbosa var. corymbosa TaxID=529605 RepID=A0AAV1CV72_OLDCO|nr:OLC1v1035072C1 [Oldenlandia corymbosa var. corymbosa]